MDAKLWRLIGNFIIGNTTRITKSGMTNHYPSPDVMQKEVHSTTCVSAPQTNKNMN